ncbi:MAG: PQQ-binding-like beta-propeller repeat protein [Pirellulaceae bacterium]
MNIKSVLFLGMVVAAFTNVLGGDWAYWRGPEHNGISRETGLVSDWSLETGRNVLWVSPIGGRATPIVLNGRVYLDCRTSHDVNDPEAKIHAREQVVCRDANTGELLWKDEFNVFQTDIPAPRVGWAAMTGDTETGYVYVHSVSGIFRCYDADGNVVWEHSLFEDFGKISGYGGRTQTPIVDEDRVMVGFLVRNWGETKGPSPKHTHYAFDKRTGKLLWISAPGGKPNDTTYSNPLITVMNGVRTFLCGDGDGGLHAINARTGEPIWRFRMSKRGLNASPVVDGNRVYISHGEDNIDSTKFGRIQCIDATGQGDVTDTHGVWRVDDIKAGYTGLLIKDGILYVVADTGKLYAFDAETGDKLWIYEELGTVGKGSPVWADGKIYATEVNGNFHILKPSRTGCDVLSRVQLRDAAGEGFDEIYASPAIADGKIFLVTRDRTICLGVADKEPAIDPTPKLPEETSPGDDIARIHLVPYETCLMGDGNITYELQAFDKTGHLIKTLKPKLEPQDDLPAVRVEGATLVVEQDPRHRAGHLIARLGDLTATARVRAFPPLPWKFDFEGDPATQPPPGWINGAVKLKPTEIDGTTAVKHGKAVVGRPSSYLWIGPSEMKDYTIQADVLMKEDARRLPNTGITAQRYNLFLKGNYLKLAVQSWPPHKRMAKEVRFRADPDIWYTLRLRVDVEEDGAHVRGKAWKRGTDEPVEWTIDAIDPHPNTHGSPGLYIYALADSYYDNIIVTKD